MCASGFESAGLVGGVTRDGVCLDAEGPAGTILRANDCGVCSGTGEMSGMVEEKRMETMSTRINQRFLILKRNVILVTMR